MRVRTARPPGDGAADVSRASPRSRYSCAGSRWAVDGHVGEEEAEDVQRLARRVLVPVLLGADGGGAGRGGERAAAGRRAGRIDPVDPHVEPEDEEHHERGVGQPGRREGREREGEGQQEPRPLKVHGGEQGGGERHEEQRQPAPPQEEPHRVHERQRDPRPLGVEPVEDGEVGVVVGVLGAGRLERVGRASWRRALRRRRRRGLRRHRQAEAQLVDAVAAEEGRQVEDPREGSAGLGLCGMIDLVVGARRVHGGAGAGSWERRRRRSVSIVAGRRRRWRWRRRRRQRGGERGGRRRRALAHHPSGRSSLSRRGQTSHRSDSLGVDRAGEERSLRFPGECDGAIARRERQRRGLNRRRGPASGGAAA